MTDKQKQKIADDTKDMAKRLGIGIGHQEVFTAVYSDFFAYHAEEAEKEDAKPKPVKITAPHGSEVTVKPKKEIE